VAEFLIDHLDYVLFLKGLSLLASSLMCFVLGRSLGANWRRFGTALLMFGLHAHMELLDVTIGHSLGLAVLRVVIGDLAYLLLLDFARLATFDYYRINSDRRVVLPLFIVGGGIAVAGWRWAGLDAAAMYGVGLTTGLWTAFALWLISRRMRTPLATRFMQGASLSFAVFTVAGGSVVHALPFADQCWINSDSIVPGLNLPYQIFRAVPALTLLIYLTCAMQAEHVAERRNRGEGNQPLWMVKVLLPILILISGGWVVTTWVGYEGHNAMRNNLVVRAMTASAALDPSDVEGLQGNETDDGSPLFERLRVQLARIRESNPDCRFVYLTALRGNKVIFLVDSEPKGSRDYSPPGQVYEEVGPQMLGVFRTSLADVEGPFSDRWGRWVSGLAPVLSQHSRGVVAVLGADVQADQWERTKGFYRLGSILVVDVLALMVLMLFTGLQFNAWASATLAASEARYRSVVENIREVIFSTDIDGRWSYLNAAWSEITGFPVASSMGQLFMKAVHPDDRPAAGEAIRPLLALESEHCLQVLRFLTRSGGFRWIEVSARLVLDEFGQISGMTGTLRDVTSERQSADALQRSRAELRRLALVASRTNNAVLITGAQGGIEWINEAFTRITGFEAGEVIGRKPTDLLRGDEADPAAIERLNGQLARNQSFVGELQGCRKDGSLQWLAIEVQPILDADGQLGGFIAIESDITERRKSEAELRQTMAELARFNRVMVGRELRVVELKREVNSLRLAMGQPIVYPSADGDMAAKVSSSGQGAER
jgi:PAS domain S-box-containing protein